LRDDVPDPLVLASNRITQSFSQRSGDGRRDWGEEMDPIRTKPWGKDRDWNNPPLGKMSLFGIKLKKFPVSYHIRAANIKVFT
jgi:hypothetical protein